MRKAEKKKKKKKSEKKKKRGDSGGQETGARRGQRSRRHPAKACSLQWDPVRKWLSCVSVSLNIKNQEAHNQDSASSPAWCSSPQVL